MSMNKRGLTLVSLLIGLLVVVVFISGILYLWQGSALAPGQVATSTPVGWSVYMDPEERFSFIYPDSFGANVWRVTTHWPPAPKVFATTTEAAILAGCPQLESPRATTTGVTTSGDMYTLYKSSGAGAGSLYDNSCFVFEKDGSQYVTNILIQSHTGCGNNQCGAYCDTPNEAECRGLDRAKDIEEPIKEIINSFSFVK